MQRLKQLVTVAILTHGMNQRELASAVLICKAWFLSIVRGEKDFVHDLVDALLIVFVADRELVDELARDPHGAT